jgi:hypothetical protein
MLKIMSRIHINNVKIMHRIYKNDVKIMLKMQCSQSSMTSFGSRNKRPHERVVSEESIGKGP